MKITDLQAFVKTLAAPLSSVGVSKTVCTDLERVAAALEPFGDLTISQFADFLAKAEEYHRTGVLASPLKKARTPAVKPGALTVPEALQRVQCLYDRAPDPTLTYVAIEAEIKQLDKALTLAQALELAQELDLVLSKKTKKATFEEIKRRIFDRKGSFERTQFRGQAVPTNQPPAPPQG